MKSFVPKNMFDPVRDRMSDKAKAILFHMGSVMDLWGISFARPVHPLSAMSEFDAFHQDAEALSGDWRNVGLDLWSAMIAEANVKKQKQAP